MIEWIILGIIYLWWGLGVFYITFAPREELIGKDEEQTAAQKIVILLTWPLWITAMSAAFFIDFVQHKVARYIFKKAFGGMFK